MRTLVRLDTFNMVPIYVYAAFEDFPDQNVKIKKNYAITFLPYNLV